MVPNHALPLRHLDRMHLVFPRNLSNRFDAHQGFQSHLRLEGTCIPFPFCFAHSPAFLSYPAEPEKSNLATGPNYGVHFSSPTNGSVRVPQGMDHPTNGTVWIPPGKMAPTFGGILFLNGKPSPTIGETLSPDDKKLLDLWLVGRLDHEDDEVSQCCGNSNCISKLAKPFIKKI